MAWENSSRRSSLPSDWSKIRKRILRRDDYLCQWRESNGSFCSEMATDVDHITPSGSDEDWNLRSLCNWHHKHKSSKEGASAAAQRRKEISSRFRRPSETETHPGRL